MITQKEFNAERRYQTAIIFAKKMLDEGIINQKDYAEIDTKLLINQKDYAEIDTKLLEKYRPTMSTLLSGKPLIK